MRTMRPATTTRPTTIPTHTFQVQPLRGCMLLELSISDLLRLVFRACVSLPLSKRLDTGDFPVRRDECSPKWAARDAFHPSAHSDFRPAGVRCPGPHQPASTQIPHEH